MADFQRTDNGRYQTAGLSAKDFTRVFSQIRKDKTAKRKSARRILTPFILKNKDLDDILTLGRRKNGTYFTKDDLKKFEATSKATKAVLNNKTAGITYAQLISHCLAIDVKRANNRVNDGSGITNATPVSIKDNLLKIRVAASSISADQYHQVEIRFEEWDDLIGEVQNDSRKNKALVKQLCAGRMSFNCDCGRHQYWYRYIATAGNFAVAPPKEYAYPKEKNPELKGIACKHVIHAMTRLQSPAWQMRVLQTMEHASKKTGAGGTSRTEHFSEDEQKTLNRNRRTKTNQAIVKKEWELYQRRQAALAKKLSGEDAELASMRKKLTRARTMTDAQRRKAEAAQRQLQKERDKNALLSQQLADQFVMRKQTFIDALVSTGMSPDEAEKRFMATAKGN